MHCLLFRNTTALLTYFTVAVDLKKRIQRDIPFVKFSQDPSRVQNEKKNGLFVLNIPFLHSYFEVCLQITNYFRT